jgi:hypothetical protein
MPHCPQCKKEFLDLPRKCPTCMADLDLLVDYVKQLHVGLDQAERLTRAGELGQAVWAYLAVLEVDPDNPTARQQVGQVATAVRQFDRTSPGRRWLFQLRGERPSEGGAQPWLRWLSTALLGIMLLFVGFSVGYLIGNPATNADDKPEQKSHPRPLPNPAPRLK